MKSFFIAIFWFVFCTTFLAPKAAFAAPGFPLHEEWTSVRALGMGNAYTAVVDDADSLFYNPAGLNRVSGVNWEVIDPRVGTDDLKVMDTINKFKSSSNLTDAIQSEYGKYHWLNGGAKSVITIPHFGFGVFANSDTLLSVTNPPYPQLSMQSYTDYGGVAGLGFDLVPMILRVGVDAKYIIRTGTEQVFTSDQLAALTSDDIANALKSTGNGYSLDSGLLLTIPAPILKPTLSFVWKNMGCTAFTKTGGPSAPPRIQDEMIVGGAVEIAVPLISITPSFDYKYLGRDDIQFGKKISLGVEISLPVFNFRGGFNQGYYTAGVGMDLAILRLDAATYAEELGVYPGQIEDRRYIVQATFEIGFDFFGLFDGSGGGSRSSDSSSSSSTAGSYRRGLKQRR